MPRKKKAETAASERHQRRSEIMKAVGDSMSALSAKKPMDWTRENTDTIFAGAVLDEAMFEYVEGSVTREQVKAAYKGYADLHILEKGTD